MQGLEFNERINQLWWNLADNHYLGDNYFYLGEYQRAINHYTKVIRLLEKKNVYPSWLNLSKIAIARTKAICNEEHIEMKWIYGCASQTKIKILGGLGKRYIAEFLLYSGKEYLSEAEKWIKQSIEVDDKRGMMFHLGQDYVVYAEILKQKSQKSQAKESLRKAIQIFKECRAEKWLEKYEIS